MGRNYVVLRRSPDWIHFDLENTRAFLSSLNLGEDLIIRFAERWDAEMAVSFLEYRQAMKDLSLACVDAVRGAEVVSHMDVGGMNFADDDLLFFTDDDDWIRADVFEVLRAAGQARDGWLWRSIFVGKMFTDTLREQRGGPLVQERAASDFVYTNNYAVTGAAWNRLGAEHLLEHYSVNGAFKAGLFAPDPIDDLMSAANKHLCCTGCVQRHSGLEGFLDDLPGAVSQVLAEVGTVQLSERTRWIAGSLERFAAINRSALKAT